MRGKLTKRLLAVSVATVMAASALSGCASQQGAAEATTKDETAKEDEAESVNEDALTWNNPGGFGKFFEMLQEEEPDITIAQSSYAGANRTGYSWAQMRGDDITDIYTTAQILDEDLAKDRLIDLSDYDFVNHMSTALLDQVEIDGGIYLLPVSNAMYGIYYNKTLMEEHGWEIPTNYAELEALCQEITKEGLIPGYVGTQLTGNFFSAIFNLAKTDWLTTPAGVSWEKDFLAGNATAAGAWEDTMAYGQKYLDIGMFHTDPDDRPNDEMIQDYLGNRKAVFMTMAGTVGFTKLSNGDQLGMMPYIGEDGSKNIYMYNPVSYIGLSKRLLEPGNEEKLEKAVRMLSLIYSEKGQATFTTGDSPCILGVLDAGNVPEDSMIYDAQQSMRDGRAFPMTYAHWENVLSDMGQAYKDWFQGVDGMDGAGAIARMDELQSDYLNNAEMTYFCEAATDFTVEEAAKLVGNAVGSATDADAVMVAVGSYRESGATVGAGVTGKLYKGKINVEVANTIAPAFDGNYAVMNMTGAQAEEVAAAGFDAAGDGNPFEYLLVTKQDKKLELGETYRVVFLMNGYTEEVAQTYGAVVEEGSLRTFLRDWLTEQKTVSPDGNPWN